MSAILTISDNQGYQDSINKIGSFPISGFSIPFQYECGDDTWAVLYDNFQYQGDATILEPNQKSSLMLAKSLRIFDHPPVNLEQVMTKFLAENENLSQYTTTEIYNMIPEGVKYWEFKMQGCTYRFYYPQIAQRTLEHSFVEFYMKMEQIGEKRDNKTYTNAATLHFSMNTEARLIDKITVKYIEDSTPHIPDWIIDIADFAVKETGNILDKCIKKWVNRMTAEEAREETKEVVGDVLDDIDGDVDVLNGDVLGGINLGKDSDDGDSDDDSSDDSSDDDESLLDKVIDKTIDCSVKVITFGIDHINDVIDIVATWMKIPDGGYTYFPSVITHHILRLAKAYVEEILPEHIDSIDINLDMDKVKESLNAGGNEKLSFEVSNQDGLNGTLSCYHPDISMSPGNKGMYCSVKVSDDLYENHVSMNMAFNQDGELVYIQAGVYIDTMEYDQSNAPNSGMITYNEDDNIIQIIRNGEISDGDDGTNVNEDPSWTSLTGAFQSCLQDSIDTTSLYYAKFNAPAELPLLSIAAQQVAEAICNSIKVQQT